MSKIENIAKNTSYLTIALILQKIISFSYFTLLARYLGPADLGKYYFAISFTTIFAIFIDLGFANVLTREIAKNKEKAASWLGNVLSLKLPLALMSILAVFISINSLNYEPLIVFLVYISCVSMVLDSFTATFFSVVRGFHNLKYESIASIVFQLIVLIFGYSALMMGGSLIWAMSALILASLYNFIYSFSVLKFKIKVSISFLYNRRLMRKILIISWPFATYAVFQRLYTYLDSVLLSLFAGDIQVGLYQVAFKIIFALQFLPMAFVASLYPAMSSYWQNNREQLLVSFNRSLNYLIIISIPIIVGAIVLADKIVLLFKTGYDGAILPLQIAIASLFFIFINFPIGSLLNACDRQRRQTFNMGIVLVISILINLFLIPRWQAVGASVTVLITNFLMFILGIYWVKKIIPYKSFENWKTFFKALLASILMGLAILFGKMYLNIFIITIIGGFIYFAFLYILKGFRRDDIASVINSLKR